MNRRFLITVLGFVWLFALSCGGGHKGPAQTSSTSVTKDHSFVGGPFQKILVIGVFKEPALRRLFENTIVDKFVAVGPAAVASFTWITQDDALTREIVEQKIADTGVDAVLVTRILGSGIESQETLRTGGPDTAPPTFTQSLGGSNLWMDRTAAYQPAGSPGYAVEQNVIQTETSLYEAQNGDQVWNASRKSTFSGDRTRTVNEIGQMIVTELQTANLI